MRARIRVFAYSRLSSSVKLASSSFQDRENLYPHVRHFAGPVDARLFGTINRLVELIDRKNSHHCSSEGR